MGQEYPARILRRDMNIQLLPSHAPSPSLAPALAPPSKAHPSEVLRKRMHRAVLVQKRICGDGRIGSFVLRVDPSVLGEWQAGQYVGIGLDTPEGFTVRSYSIASSPLDHESLELLIALVPSGKLTPTIFQQEIGSTWHHLTPKGHFTLAKAQKHTLVMIATGTGLAPFLSQIRTLWHLHRSGIPISHRIILLHGVSFADERDLFKEELERYAAARAEGFDFTYIGTASRPDSVGRGWSEKLGRGRVNDLIRQIFSLPMHDRAAALPAGLEPGDQVFHGLRDHAGSSVWLACGNPLMIEDLRGPAQALGVAKLLSEQYWQAQVTAL